LTLADWRDTYRTIHMYTQIVGKMRLAHAPLMNEWWQVALYVTTRGLTTTPIVYGDRTMEIAFDFHHHTLVVTTSDGTVRTVPLGGTVHAFYDEVLAVVNRLGFPTRINPMPVEIAQPVRFDADDRPAGYDPAMAQRCFQVMSRVDGVFKRFRARFTGKASPVHFFWGSFDLTTTRFSGQPAPVRQGDAVSAWAYRSTLASLGFWPGGEFPGVGQIDEPIFYAYNYPVPQGLETTPVQPEVAAWHPAFGEFVLPYAAGARASCGRAAGAYHPHGAHRGTPA